VIADVVEVPAEIDETLIDDEELGDDVDVLHLDDTVEEGIEVASSGKK
jgi:hypothetical protein